MPLPPVVVQIAPSDVAFEHRRVLLDACTRAVGNTDCVSADGRVDGHESLAFAIVSLRAADHVRIEVALRPQDRWIVRELDFEPGSPPAERFRTAGFVVGTLASGTMGADPEPVETAPPDAAPAPSEGDSKPPATPASEAEVPRPERVEVPSPPVTSEGVQSSEPAARRAVLVLGGVAGPALSPGPLRLGGELGARFYPLAIPSFATLSAEYARTPSTTDGVEAEWMVGLAGLGYELEPTRLFSLLVVAEGFVQRLQATLPSPSAPRPTSGDRWLGGARVGLEAVWWFAEPVGALVGAAGEWAGGTTEIRRSERTVTTEQPIRFVGRAGFCYAFR